jgi:hypothetical protein
MRECRLNPGLNQLRDDGAHDAHSTGDARQRDFGGLTVEIAA